jgi:hypothetical protein
MNVYNYLMQVKYIYQQSIFIRNNIKPEYNYILFIFHGVMIIKLI